MRVNIKTKNFELTAPLENLVNTKLVEPAKKLLAKLDEKVDIIFDIELELTTKHRRKGRIWRAEAQLDLPGPAKVLRAEAVTESLRASIDEIKYELLREIKKYKKNNAS